MKRAWTKSGKKAVITVLAAVGVLALYGCDAKKQETSKEEVTTVSIGVVGEYNEQWDTVNHLLEKEGIKIELRKFSDYAAPNRALNDGEIDLNSFQHKAFLANDIEQKGYKIEAIGDTLIAPLTIYNNKEKISSIEDIKDGDIIAIPSDLTNGGRALKLLEEAGLIVCDPEKGFLPTKADILKYHKKIEIREGESATLFNILPDCAAAIINGGNAFTAGLDPKKDSIFTENVDPAINGAVPQLINVIVARSEDKDNPVYKKIVEAYQTKEVKDSIESAYRGAFISAWEGAENLK